MLIGQKLFCSSHHKSKLLPFSLYVYSFGITQFHYEPLSGIVLPLVAGLALSTQKESIVVPVINIKLGMWFQTTLLICSLLLWLQFVRSFWYKNVERKALNKAYWRFLVFEIIVRFPALVAPLVIIISALTFVNPTFISAVILLIFLTGLFIVMGGQQNNDYYYDKWNEDKRYREKWAGRIWILLEKKKHVETEDFVEFGLDPVKSWEEINDIIAIYFSIYEKQLNLRKSPVTIIHNTVEKTNIFGKTIKYVVNSYKKTSIWIAKK